MRFRETSFIATSGHVSPIARNLRTTKRSKVSPIWSSLRDNFEGLAASLQRHTLGNERDASTSTQVPILSMIGAWGGCNVR